MDSVTNTSYLFVVRIHKAEFRVVLRHFVIHKRLLELSYNADCLQLNKRVIRTAYVLIAVRSFLYRTK